MNHFKKDYEDFMDYAERLLANKDYYDLDKCEIYELLYNKQVSSDHARKALTTLQMTIDEYKKSRFVTESIIKENEDNQDDQNIINKNNIIELNKDGSQTSNRLIHMNEQDAKSVDFLLKAHGYSISEWELVSARNNIWNVSNKKDGILTLYSSKIVVKPKKEFAWNKENIRNLFSSIKTDYKHKINLPPKQYEKNGNALVIPIADLHYGLLSDTYSANNDYNLEIAEDIYYYTLNDIVNRVKGRNFEKILFIIGNDFVNADNLNGTTTKQTIQDNSASWFTTVLKATQLIIDGIDMLTKIAPVEVQYVMSNHDLHTMYGIIQTVNAWYRNDKNVFVDNIPLPRKYCRIGKTLLCLSHNVKVKDALKIITTEAKDEWSQSKHIICMLAHLHQAMIYEKQGCLEIMRLPTVSGWSRWSNDNGYIQIEKKNQSFIINNELGITDVINTIIQ